MKKNCLKSLQLISDQRKPDRAFSALCFLTVDYHFPCVRIDDSINESQSKTSAGNIADVGCPI